MGPWDHMWRWEALEQLLFVVYRNHKTDLEVLQLWEARRNWIFLMPVCGNHWINKKFKWLWWALKMAMCIIFHLTLYTVYDNMQKQKY